MLDVVYVVYRKEKMDEQTKFTLKVQNFNFYLPCTLAAIIILT